MAMELPDVNVLIALFDPKRVHHEAAQGWFAVLSEGWATCPLTGNGFLRLISNPNYANLPLSVSEVASGLRNLIAAEASRHVFWADDVSLGDTALFDLNRVQGFRQLTDLYLLGLCQRHEATLVTFDSRTQMATFAPVAPRENLVRVLTS